MKNMIIAALLTFAAAAQAETAYEQNGVLTNIEPAGVYSIATQYTAPEASGAAAQQSSEAACTLARRAVLMLSEGEAAGFAEELAAVCGAE